MISTVSTVLASATAVAAVPVDVRSSVVVACWEESNKTGAPLLDGYREEWQQLLNLDAQRLDDATVSFALAKTYPRIVDRVIDRWILQRRGDRTIVKDQETS